MARVTCDSVASAGACSQLRCTSNCEGFGKVRKSVATASSATASQRIIAAIKRGAHQAGTNQRKPSNNTTKKRMPKLNGSQPLDRARASTGKGTSGRGKLIRFLSFANRAGGPYLRPLYFAFARSFRYFH